MKNFFKRFLSLTLVVMMVATMLPSNVFAIDNALSADRTYNSIRVSGIGFSDPATGTWFQPMVDKASGAVLFCVDPGHGIANANAYSVSIANDADVLGLIQSARGKSMLGNVSTSGDNSPGNSWQMDVDTAVLESLDPIAFNRLVQAISTLNYHTLVTGKYGPSSAGEKYNTHYVAAVQYYVWSMVSHTPFTYRVPYGNTRAQVLKAWQTILEDMAELYGNGAGQQMYFWDGLRNFAKTQETTEAAQNRPLNIKYATDGQIPLFSSSTRDKEAFSKIKYISIDGGGVQSFKVGDTAKAGTPGDPQTYISITRTADGMKVDIPEWTVPEGTNAEDAPAPVHTVQFLTTNIIPTEIKESSFAEDSWALYARYANGYQSFFSVYQTPQSKKMFLSLKNSKGDPEDPEFPAFSLSQLKVSSTGGFDGNVSTPEGGSKLDAGFSVSYKTMKSDGTVVMEGTEYSQASAMGTGASATIWPWGESPDNEKEITSYTEVEEEYEEEPIEGEEPPEEPVKIPFVKELRWEGKVDITVSETSAPTGHLGSSTTYTHTVEYLAVSKRETPYDEFLAPTYTIKVDGVVTNLVDNNSIMATIGNPYPISTDTFSNEPETGNLKILKTIESDDIFATENGDGTLAGGNTPGKEFSQSSAWTLRVIDPSVYEPDVSAAEAAEKFSGYENCPYVKVAPDTAMQGTAIGAYANCYKVMLDGSGTPADESNPLTVGDFGEIFVSGLPYGTYLLTEIKADGDRYVTESMYFQITRNGQSHSVDINNIAKENVLKVVKTDSETGKVIPSPSTAFRIRYLGSPEYENPEETPNYNKLLPNATTITGDMQSEDYIFYTDAAGEVTIPYEIPYGSYQLEEIIVPKGYYIGTYENGVGSADQGQANISGTDGEGGLDDYEGTTGEQRDFNTQVSGIYDDAGNKIEFTADPEVTYNYYKFDVTEQAGHVDSEGYITYYLTVEIENTATKGMIEISKTGESLVGFKAEVDEYGNEVLTPVYEYFPLEGVEFGIYAAEDILLEDGEEPPVAYDKLTEEEIELVTEVLNHVQFPNAEIVQSGVHEDSGAEVIYTKQRESGENGENNLSTVEYLTPVQKGTKYYVEFSRYDAGAGLTYDYEVEFGFEYTAGGWNYTDIAVTRTITADDYTPYIPDELPGIYNGDEEVEYSNAVFDNKNKLEVKSEIQNDYNLDENHYVIQQYFTGVEILTPEIENVDSIDSLVYVPEIPEEYSLHQISNERITIVHDRFVNDIRAAIAVDRDDDKDGKVNAEDDDDDNDGIKDKDDNDDDGDGIADDNEDEDPDYTYTWESITTAAPENYLGAHYKEEVVTNLPELPDGVEFLYATKSFIYVSQDDVTKIICTNQDGGYEFYLPDMSDVQGNDPPADSIPVFKFKNTTSHGRVIF